MKQIGILTGPTASGKSSLALFYAQKYSLEIINADSLLFYKGVNIGAAKPSKEELSQIPHHLIDLKEPDQPFNAADFILFTKKTIQEIESRNKKALIVGGSGFYLKALMYGLWIAPPSNLSLRQSFERKSNQELKSLLLVKDPHAQIHEQDRYRLIRSLEILEGGKSLVSDLQMKNKLPDPSFKLFVIDRNTLELHQRIKERTQQMLDQGFLDEVLSLRSNYPHSSPLSSVGYKQVSAYLEGELPKGRKIAPGVQGLQDEINLATRQLVKKQRTWFQSELKRNSNAKRFILDSELTLLDDEMKTLYGNS